MINLTQHQASEEQKIDGVIDLPATELVTLKTLLTIPFSKYNKKQQDILILDLHERAAKIVELVKKFVDQEAQNGEHVDPYVMLGGHPALMNILAEKLKAAGIRCFQSVTDRVTVEKNGVKTSVFKHLYFISWI